MWSSEPFVTFVTFVVSYSADKLPTAWDTPLRDSNADRAAQCDNPNELMSPPEKNVPMMLPRVIGRSKRDGWDSS